MNTREYERQRLILLEKLLMYLRSRSLKTFSVPMTLYEIMQKIEVLEKEYFGDTISR